MKNTPEAKKHIRTLPPIIKHVQKKKFTEETQDADFNFAIKECLK